MSSTASATKSLVATYRANPALRPKIAYLLISSGLFTRSQLAVAVGVAKSTVGRQIADHAEKLAEAKERKAARYTFTGRACVSCGAVVSTKELAGLPQAAEFYWTADDACTTCGGTVFANDAAEARCAGSLTPLTVPGATDKKRDGEHLLRWCWTLVATDTAKVKKRKNLDAADAFTKGEVAGVHGRKGEVIGTDDDGNMVRKKGAKRCPALPSGEYVIDLLTSPDASSLGSSDITSDGRGFARSDDVAKLATKITVNVSETVRPTVDDFATTTAKWDAMIDARSVPAVGAVTCVWVNATAAEVGAVSYTAAWFAEPQWYTVGRSAVERKVAYGTLNAAMGLGTASRLPQNTAKVVAVISINADTGAVVVNSGKDVAEWKAWAKANAQGVDNLNDTQWEAWVKAAPNAHVKVGGPKEAGRNDLSDSTKYVGLYTTDDDGGDDTVIVARDGEAGGRRLYTKRAVTDALKSGYVFWAGFDADKMVKMAKVDIGNGFRTVTKVAWEIWHYDDDDDIAECQSVGSLDADGAVWIKATGAAKAGRLVTSGTVKGKVVSTVTYGAAGMIVLGDGETTAYYWDDFTYSVATEKAASGAKIKGAAYSAGATVGNVWAVDGKAAPSAWAKVGDGTAVKSTLPDFAAEGGSMWSGFARRVYDATAVWFVDAEYGSHWYTVTDAGWKATEDAVIWRTAETVEART